MSTIKVSGVVVQPYECCNVGTFFKGFWVSKMFLHSCFKHYSTDSRHMEASNNNDNDNDNDEFIERYF